MQWLYCLQGEQPRLHTMLTEEEQTLLCSRRRGEGLEQSLCAQRLMKEALWRLTGQEHAILRTPHGAPDTRVAGLYVSAAHTGGCCVGAAARQPVGIDVERIAPVRPRVMERCFTMGERALVLAHPRPDECFTRLWTLKEAYGKLTGRGLLGLGETEFSLVCGTMQCSDPAVCLHLHTVGDFLISIVQCLPCEA